MTWSDTGLPGFDATEKGLGGEGTPLVAAFTPEPFAAALGVSTLTGLQLLADALDLQHRLPRLWAAVEALRVAPWKARKIAQATHNLSQAAAASVDRQLADRDHRRGHGRRSGICAVANRSRHADPRRPGYDGNPTWPSSTRPRPPTSA